MVELHNIDCMELMQRYPDDYFDLAIVDPPFGIGNFVQISGNVRGSAVSWNDSTPPEEYFNELKRVSKERIIWGANYYNCFEKDNGAIVWNKGVSEAVNFSKAEIASCTQHKSVQMINLKWQNINRPCETIHPCQKPVALYRWLLEKYAKQGDIYSRKKRILDTHLGSGSSAIAAYQLGYYFVGCELDKNYFQAMQKRVKQAMKQTSLFQSAEEKQAEQIKIF